MTPLLAQLLHLATLTEEDPFVRVQQHCEILDFPSDGPAPRHGFVAIGLVNIGKGDEPMLPVPCRKVTPNEVVAFLLLEGFVTRKAL